MKAEFLNISRTIQLLHHCTSPKISFHGTALALTAIQLWYTGFPYSCGNIYIYNLYIQSILWAVLSSAQRMIDGSRYIRIMEYHMKSMIHPYDQRSWEYRGRKSSDQNSQDSQPVILICSLRSQNGLASDVPSGDSMLLKNMQIRYVREQIWGTYMQCELPVQRCSRVKRFITLRTCEICIFFSRPRSGNPDSPLAYTKISPM